MRTLILLSFILTVVCEGDRSKYQRFVDFLMQKELDIAKRHEFQPEIKRQPLLHAPERNAFTPEEIPNGVIANMQAMYSKSVTNVNGIVENECMELDEAFLFPESHFLIDEIKEHCESGTSLKIGKDEIKENFRLPCGDHHALGQSLRVLKAVQNPKGVALLLTRQLIHPLLTERSKCPATIVDMAIARALLNQKEKFMKSDDSSLFTFFKKMAPLIDQRLGDMADDIAAAAVHELHGTVFKQTLEYLWKFGLKDLAYASHDIFHHVHLFFSDLVKDDDLNGDKESELQVHLERGTSDVKCPSTAEMIEYHKFETKRFRDVFSVLEADQICLKAADFITMYVNQNIPGYVPDLGNNLYMSKLCEGIKVTIDSIVQGYVDFEHFLFTMKIDNFKVLFSKLLSEDEWSLTEEALRRLGFTD